MDPSTNSFVHRMVTLSSNDEDGYQVTPSAISSLPMYTSELDSGSHSSSATRRSGKSEKTAVSEVYGFDYESSSSNATESNSNAFYSKKKPSFFNIPSLTAFKANSRLPFGKYAKNKKNKSAFLWILIFLAVCVLGYPIYSFSYISSNPQAIDNIFDKPIWTADPLIYPDLDSLFKSKSSVSNANRQSSMKSPTDHSYDLSDKEVPAAAKKNRPGIAPGGVAGNQVSGNEANPENSKDSVSNENEPKTSNSEFQNRNAIIGSLKYKATNKESSFWGGFGSDAKSGSGNSPELVIVTGINPEKYSVEYLEKIIENRKKYAKRFGHALYIRLVTDFREDYEASATKSPSWAKLSILRAAVQAFPKAKHFWNLDANALIENMESNIVTDLIDPETLKHKIVRNRPILRANNIIKTYKHMSSANTRLILAPDEVGVSTASFIIANLDRDATIDFAGAKHNRYNVKKFKGGQHGLFAKSLLEYWNNNALRTYPHYDRNEASALSHMLQWHPTFLSRTAIVSGHELMSYSEETVAMLLGIRGNNLQLAYQLPVIEGELTIDDYERDGLIFHYKNPASRGRVVVIASCASGSSITCLREISKYNNLQDKNYMVDSVGTPQNIPFGNNQQRQQLAQAQQAQAQVQAQAEQNANPLGLNFGSENSHLDPQAQLEADIARMKQANDPKAQLEADIARIKKEKEAQAQVDAGIAKLEQEDDSKTQVEADKEKDVLAQVKADIAKLKQQNKPEAQGATNDNAKAQMKDQVKQENPAGGPVVVGGAEGDKPTDTSDAQAQLLADIEKAKAAAIPFGQGSSGDQKFEIGQEQNVYPSNNDAADSQGAQAVQGVQAAAQDVEAIQAAAQQAAMDAVKKDIDAKRAEQAAAGAQGAVVGADGILGDQL